MADIFDTYPHWNERASENMSCWICQHFQRYDADGSKNWCEGECRQRPPENSLLTYHNPNWYLSDTFFPFMAWSNVAWCSGFQRSLEHNIPAPPATKFDCANQLRINWVLPPTINTGSLAPIPNKKPLEETCWFCLHFQRQGETPSTTDPEYCRGYCCIQPPKTYFRQDPDWVSGKLNVDPTWPIIENGPIIWCSKFTRTTRTVPPPPSQGGVLCGQGG